MQLSFRQPQVDKRLEEFFNEMGRYYQKAVGYPVAKDFDYAKLLPFMELSLNNCGDPFSGATYKVHSHSFEREVIEFMADLFNAPPEDRWGYVTTGGTEGNLYGLYLGRQRLPNAIAYYSDAAHYSIAKNLRILRQECQVVASDENDEMDYTDLARQLDPSRPAIIMASIGTTMMEGRDDLAKIQECLTEAGISEYYIHCDAALEGMIAPFTQPRPAFDFAAGAHSIAVSGHKFLGCPMPCGVVVCRRSNVESISTYIPYIDGYDETITGSRNGLTPLFLWYGLVRTGVEGLRSKVVACQRLALYAKAQIEQLGIPVHLNHGAITLVFPKPGPKVVEKWQPATQGTRAHLLTVPGVTSELIDGLVKDLREDLQGDPAHLSYEEKEAVNH